MQKIHKCKIEIPRLTTKDFEIGPKFAETQDFQKTIRHPYIIHEPNSLQMRETLCWVFLICIKLGSWIIPCLNQALVNNIPAILNQT